VVTLDGVELGIVASLFATGANDVLVVKGERERLLPFVRGQVVTRSISNNACCGWIGIRIFESALFALWERVEVRNGNRWE
jgi:hypothetical protein